MGRRARGRSSGSAGGAAAPVTPAPAAPAPPAPAPPTPPREGGESLKEKLILLVIESLVIGGIIFVFGQRYQELKSLDDVKWEKSKVECVNPPGCGEGRQTFSMYRLGGATLENVRVQFAIVDPEKYEVLDGKVRQYEKSVVNYMLAPRKGDADGIRINYGNDPLDEVNDSTTYGFILSRLASDFVYELEVVTRSKKGNPLAKYGVFQVRDAAGRQYPHEGLVFNDYLRLYFIEGIVLLVISLAILTVVIWKVGRRLLPH
ncbi:MAG TPA: hypothetical protein VGX48_17025 [Pyrinomonadaceae bacterium]|jgi:hypothetical protein|nr:hypothetical protein [Pyrinomonadaceae bacterium]